MSTIDIRHAHTLSAADSRPRIAQFEETLAKYGAKLDWSGDTAEIKGTGVSGNVKLADKLVSITIKLGLLARAVVDPARLEASIRKRLAAAFGDDKGAP